MGNSGVLLLLLILVGGGIWYFSTHQTNTNPTQSTCDKSKCIDDALNYVINQYPNSPPTTEGINQLRLGITQQIEHGESECLGLGGTIKYQKSSPAFSYGDSEETTTFNPTSEYHPTLCNLFCNYDGHTIIIDELSNYERMRQNKACRDEVNTILLSSNPTVDQCKNLQCQRKEIFWSGCVQSLAVKKNDLSICDQINSDGWTVNLGGIPGCYADIAILRNDPTICAPLQSAGDSLTANNRGFWREGCYYHWILRNGDFGAYDWAKATTNCQGAYGKLGSWDSDCAPVLCHNTGGTWTQAGLSCSCSTGTFNMLTGCV